MESEREQTPNPIKSLVMQAAETIPTSAYGRAMEAERGIEQTYGQSGRYSFGEYPRVLRK